ncbi:MAG: hypothetical protein HYY79_03555 [Betaproteobacteria bacterium]|nr:hypothetical protein [Betaproteobacteria bacterium]
MFGGKNNRVGGDGVAMVDVVNSAMRHRLAKLFAFRASSRWSYWIVLPLVCAAIVVTAAQSYRAIDQELTEVALSRRAAVAQLAATTLSEKFARLVDVGVSLATRVRFRELVAEGRWEEASRILREVPRDLPFIERLFLTDVEGTLRADVPQLPGVRGVSFAYREWYQEVRRDWRPYVSPVYQRAAKPRLEVFAVAVPIKKAGGDAAGILVLQLRTDTFFEWAGGFEGCRWESSTTPERRRCRNCSAESAAWRSPSIPTHGKRWFPPMRPRRRTAGAWSRSNRRAPLLRRKTSS